MIDAVNAKIDAEPEAANAEINVGYTYYALKKTVGFI